MESIFVIEIHVLENMQQIFNCDHKHVKLKLTRMDIDCEWDV